MYDVDLDQLADAVAEMTRCGEALDLLLDDVGRHVARLHDTWAGDAALAQAEAQASWEAGFREMRAGLATMRSAGAEAGESYRSAADTNLRMWGQVS